MVFAGELTSDRDSVVAEIDKLTASTENIKIYDATNKVATIKSPDASVEYAKIKLLTPLNNFVGLGYQKVAEFEIDSKVSYADFLKQMYFFDIKNKNVGVRRGFDLKKEIVTIKEEPIFETVCLKVDDENKGNCLEFELKDTGRTNLVNVVDYELLSEKNFGVEKQVVSMWIQIDKPETIEWIPELYGTIINEWASWTSNYDVNLIAYWKLDETSGTVLYDSVGGDNNLTLSAGTVNEVGKINRGISFTNLTSQKATATIPSTVTALTMCAWVNPSDTNEVGIFLGYGNGTSTGNFLTRNSNNNSGSAGWGLSGLKPAVAWEPLSIVHKLNLSNWQYICLSKTGTASHIFYNGVDSTASGNSLDATGITAFSLGSTGSIKAFTGVIDEVALWYRELSATDINYLYNNGAGLGYQSSDGFSQSRITWNVYKKGTSTHLTSVNLDCNVNAFDATAQLSPFNTSYVDTNTNFSCDFSRSGYDSNTGFKGIVDSNKTVTVYLTESLPTVEQTTQQGFKLYSTTYITGTGNISALASSAGGIASCQYTQNGSTWVNADYNGTHCINSVPITIINNQTYKFNFHAVNSVGGDANGTPIATLFTGDTNAPYTTVTLTDYNNSNYKFIQATCSDAGSGCKGITFEFDGNGTKYYSAGATKDLNFSGLGYHYVKIYSTDNLDLNETIKTIDLNMPTLLTIKYPKNIQTIVQLTEKWTLITTGAVTLNLTNLSTDYNVYVPSGVLTTFFIGDVNGNYTQNTYTRTYYNNSNTDYDTLQPYLYAITTSLITTINVVSASTNQPIQDVTVKIYGNLPGLGNTLIGQGTSDSKGQILQLFIGGQSYVFDTYYNGVLIKSFNITATTSTIFLVLSLSELIIVQPTPSGYSSSWTPGNSINIQTVGNQVFTQTLNNFGSKSISVVSTLTQNSANLSAPQNYVGSSNKTFTYTVAWAGIVTGKITQKMVVTTSDGNVFTFTQNINVIEGFGAGYNPLQGLSIGLRSDLTCSTDPLVPCFPLLVIAFLICIGLTIWATLQFGIIGIGQSSGFIFLVGMILFTYLTWIPVWVTAGLVLIMLAFILNESG
jgi:hypothetical protein